MAPDIEIEILTLSDPYETARAHISLACDFLKLTPEQAAALREAHETALIRGPDGTLLYANGDPDVAAWLRSVDAMKPELLGKRAKPSAEVPGSRDRDWSDATFTELHLGVRTGSREAQAEIERRSRVGDGTPARGAPARPVPDADTLTALMIRARAGDSAAREALTKNAR